MEWKTIEEGLDWGGDISIEELRLELDRLESMDANAIEIYLFDQYGFPGVSINAIKIYNNEEIN